MEFTRQLLKLYLITDDKGRTPAQLERIVRAALQGGVTAVQLREKSSPADLLTEAYERIGSACADAGALFLINADLLPKLNIDAHTVGVHYSSTTLPENPAHFSCAGFSAHSLDEVEQAVRAQVGFCTISPIFETPSKAGVLQPTGTRFITECQCAFAQMPFIALGGINASNARRCTAAGADGVAVMSAIMSAPDPAAAAAALRKAMRWAEPQTST